MKRFHRILSALLCLTLFIPSLATVAFAALPTVSRAVPTAPAELDSLSDYLHASCAVEDNTSHLPVNVHTYYDSNKTYTPGIIGEGGSVSILYVMNTNTERLGNKTDAELVDSSLSAASSYSFSIIRTTPRQPVLRSTGASRTYAVRLSAVIALRVARRTPRVRIPTASSFGNVLIAAIAIRQR